MPLASDVFPQVIFGESLRDDHIETTCARCGDRQSLAQATVTGVGDNATTYLCRNGCRPILTIESSHAPADGDGYSVGRWLFRSDSDLIAYSPSRSVAVHIHVATARSNQSRCGSLGREGRDGAASREPELHRAGHDDHNAALND